MSEQSEQDAAPETAPAAETQTNLSPDSPTPPPAEGAEQTEATPQSEETPLTVGLEPTEPSQAEKYLGRFSSQEEAQGAFDTLEKRVNDGQTFIQQLQDENAVYRSSLTRLSQGPATQPTPQQGATPGTAQAENIELSEADYEAMAEDPRKFHEEKLMPHVQSVAAEAARRGAQEVLGQYTPALEAAQGAALQQEETVVWDRLKTADKRFQRGDRESEMIVGQASRDFMSRFGQLVQAGQVSTADAYSYIVKSSVQAKNELEKTRNTKPAAVSNATTVRKAGGAQPAAKTEEERRKLAEDAAWQRKLRGDD